ncbi:zinc metalloprotease HtpX [Fusobacterium sp. PH5-44]|uniref:zinc metalloprotease HtpX n=1 Tax=unclassified Fusobacterium TaxID=2648384 RepID=UPI003D1DCA83
MGNSIKTFILIMLMTFIMLVVGNAVGGTEGTIVAFVIALVTNFVSYWFSDKIVLSMYRAVPLDSSHQVYKIVETLASRANLPMPKVYLINEAQPNAFATGRNPNHSAVAVTAGLLEMMNENEIAGVLGHELGHIHNRDILISSMAAVMASAITFLSTMARWGAVSGGNRRRNNNNGLILLVVSILAPIGAMLVRMAISRTREFKADKFGAEVSKNPLFLSSALEKLELGSQRIVMQANPATENLFIVNPLSGDNLRNLFSTHPSTKDRIKKLEEMTYVKN